MPIGRHLGAHLVCGSRLVESTDRYISGDGDASANKSSGTGIGTDSSAKHMATFVRAQYMNTSLVGETKQALLLRLVVSTSAPFLTDFCGAKFTSCSYAHPPDN